MNEARQNAGHYFRHNRYPNRYYLPGNHYIRQHRSKEYFDLVPQNIPIVEKEAEKYYNSLNDIQTWLDNSFNGEYGFLEEIKNYLKNAENVKNIQRDSLLKLLTSIYIINYINYVNKNNA